jgi:hypothetical protein
VQDDRARHAAACGGVIPTRHCERSEAIQAVARTGLLRRFARRNDSVYINFICVSTARPNSPYGFASVSNISK